MLTIVDLHHEEDLSASRMGKVAGGMSCGNALALSDGYLAIASVLGALGDTSGEANYSGKASGLIEGACGPQPQ